MKNNLSVFTLIFVAVLVGCQQDPSRSNSAQGGASETGVQLVQSADGSLYSVDCLKQNAEGIKAGGSTALNQCKMTLTIGSSGESRTESGKFFTGSSYAWIFYPPTYCNPTVAPTTYSSNYNPYNDKNYSSNSFCSYIFGGSYNLNCYFLFGYGSTSASNSNSVPSSTYSSSYNPSCEYCLYAPNPGRCRNRCYKYEYIYTY